MHILWLIKAIDLKLMFIMSKKKKKRCRSNNKTLLVQYRKRKFNYMGPPPSSAHLAYYNSQIWPIFPNPPYDLGPRLVSSLFPPQKRGREGGRRRRREGREGQIAGSPPAARRRHDVVDAVRVLAVVREPAPQPARPPPHAGDLLAPPEIR